MGFFSQKNSNEKNYATGKKNFADVIKNSGPEHMLIWRQPEEDFNTQSTLIVMPGEEAIFVKGGMVEQVFEIGTYKLSTENYPFISRLRNAFTGGISTFNCVVFFVNKTHSEEILWGTDSPIQVRDKVIGISTKLKARGAYRLKIDNSIIFINKLSGSNFNIFLHQELKKYFQVEFQSQIKSSIAQAINESINEIIGIDARLTELSQLISSIIAGIFSEYGIRLINFTIHAIDVDDNELRKRYDEIAINQIDKIRNAQSDKAVMNILDNNWLKQQQVDILKSISNNDNSLANTGAGLGLGLGVSGLIGNMNQSVFANNDDSNLTSEVIMSKIKLLKELLENELITKEEFDIKKKDLINKL